MYVHSPYKLLQTVFEKIQIMEKFNAALIKINTSQPYLCKAQMITFQLLNSTNMLTSQYSATLHTSISRNAAQLKARRLNEHVWNVAPPLIY